MFRKIKHFFVNVKKWFPILVEDRQYDYIYLYEVIRHKLVLMLELFSSEKASTLYVLKDVYEINYCIYLLDRLIADNYMTQEATDKDRKELFNRLENHIEGWWD